MKETFMSALASAALASSAFAVGPYIEDFHASSSNWYDAPGAAPTQWSAVGGPDGGSFATTSFNFASSFADSTPAFFRAQDKFNSSNHAFEGNYIADGITQMTYAVRHDAPTPLNFFVRFASAINFPGAAAVEFVPVQPNTWTTITIDFVDPNPSFVYEGPPATFTSVFSSVGHVQVGALVPQTLALQNIDVTFDLDKVTLIPAPASGGLLLGGLVSASRRRRTIPA